MVEEYFSDNKLQCRLPLKGRVWHFMKDSYTLGLTGPLTGGEETFKCVISEELCLLVISLRPDLGCSSSGSPPPF